MLLPRKRLSAPKNRLLNTPVEELGFVAAITDQLRRLHVQPTFVQTYGNTHIVRQQPIQVRTLRHLVWLANDSKAMHGLQSEVADAIKDLVKATSTKLFEIGARTTAEKRAVAEQVA